jgi:hypothetical protein
VCENENPIWGSMHILESLRQPEFHEVVVCREQIQQIGRLARLV